MRWDGHIMRVPNAYPHLLTKGQSLQAQLEFRHATLKLSFYCIVDRSRERLVRIHDQRFASQQLIDRLTALLQFLIAALWVNQRRVRAPRAEDLR
eukprot:111418-Prymnesium_polylepis.1